MFSLFQVFHVHVNFCRHLLRCGCGRHMHSHWRFLKQEVEEPRLAQAPGSAKLIVPRRPRDMSVSCGSTSLGCGCGSTSTDQVASSMADSISSALACRHFSQLYNKPCKAKTIHTSQGVSITHPPTLLCSSQHDFYLRVAVSCSILTFPVPGQSIAPSSTLL